MRHLLVAALSACVLSAQGSVDVTSGTLSALKFRGIGPAMCSGRIIDMTNGGSSGSVVLNSAGQVVGQLTGACGTNYDDVCDTASNATIDGALAAYYNSVSQWLDPSGGPGPGGNAMYVDSIVPGVQNRGRRARARADYYIADENGGVVSQATVTASFTGSISGSSNATTNNSGRARIQSSWVRTSNFSYTTCVTNVTHSSLSYDDTLNNETCDSSN